MKANTYGTVKVVTPNFTASFPSLFRKTGFQDQKPKYTVDAIFEKNIDLKPFMSAIKQVAEERWKKIPPNFSSDGGIFKDALFEYVIKNGDLKTTSDGEVYEGYAGKYWMKFSSINPVAMVGPDAKTPLEEDELYGGCIGRAVVFARAYGGPGTNFKPGVVFDIKAFQKVRDGELFGGNVERNFDFTGYFDDVSENPNNYDDDIPF